MLLYWQKQGPIRQHVAVSAKRLRGKFPDAFANEPQLRMGLELYYEAFFDLNSERSHGMGWTYIPWSAIVRYAQYYELDEDQADRLIHHVRAMDQAYIKQLDEDSQSKKG